MKNTLRFLSITLLAPSLASADSISRSGQRFERYEIHVTENRGKVSVRARREYKTTDCNHFSATGESRIVQGEDHSEVEYLLDLGIMGTEMACPPGPERTIYLEKTFQLETSPGVEYVYILAPTNWTIDLELARFPL